MGFFSSTPKKGVGARESFLTPIDPPDFAANQSSTSHQEEFGTASEKNKLVFLGSASHPTTNTFQNITACSLKGEQERNLILEQQVKILSHQAAKVIDQLNESIRENNHLKKQNQELLAFKKRTSLEQLGGRRQTSISSINSSQVSSIFSNGNDTGSMISKGTSMNSIASVIQSSKQTDADTALVKMLKSHESEIIELKASFALQINDLQVEIESLQREWASTRTLVDVYQAQIRNLTEELHIATNKKTNFIQKLMNTNKKQKIQVDHYQIELKNAYQQLEETRKRAHQLRQRLMEFDISEIHNTSRALC